MENSILSGPEAPPASGGKPEGLVIFLHGLGSDGQDLISLAPFFAKALPKAHFISPNAPFPCDMAPMGYQWFSLRDWSQASVLKGVMQAAPILNRFIDAQLKRFGLTDDKLALVGFSQGTMMSLYVSLRREKPCAGVVGFSGALVGDAGITSKPPICLVHGQQDTVVPFAALAAAEAFLRTHGIQVEAHARPDLPHGIDPEGIETACAFLKSRLQ